MSRRRQFACAATPFVFALTIGLVIGLAGEPKPRARQYLAFKACLLTDSDGITGKTAASVWAGMQNASLKTRAKVQYLPTAGQTTAPNVLQYLSSLVQMRCDVIITAGPGPSAAVAEGAGRFAKTQFITVGGGIQRSNVTTVNVPDTALTGEIARLVADTVDR